MTSTARKLVHWVFAHPAHRHHYSLHIQRDDQGEVRPFWRCMFLLCGEEVEVEEWT